MSRVYWDTMLFVYWMEGHPDYTRRVQELRSGMERRRDVLCTSAFTVGELLVKPNQRKRTDIAVAICDYFQSSEVQVLPFDAETAEMYGQIRAEHSISAPDAIHLAAAAHARVDLFLTNDRRLCRLTIPGIHFIAGLDTNLF